MALVLFIFLDIVIIVTVDNSKISVIAHVFGFNGGFLSGVLVVKNRKVEAWEHSFRRVIIIATGLYFLTVAVSNLVLMSVQL